MQLATSAWPASTAVDAIFEPPVYVPLLAGDTATPGCGRLGTGRSACATG